MRGREKVFQRIVLARFFVFSTCFRCLRKMVAPEGGLAGKYWLIFGSCEPIRVCDSTLLADNEPAVVPSEDLRRNIEHQKCSIWRRECLNFVWVPNDPFPGLKPLI